MTIWNAVIAFFLTPFIIGHIGAGHYGLLVLLLSISGFLELLKLGLGDATLRYVSFYYGRNDLDGINRVVKTTSLVFMVAGFIGWTLLFAGAPWIVSVFSLPTDTKEFVTGLLQLISFSFALSLMGGAYLCIPQALRRYDITTKVMIVQSVVQSSGTVIILLMGLGIYHLVLWNLVTAGLMQVLHVLVAKRLIPALSLKPSASRESLREVFGYGVYSFITSILGIIWGYADRLIVGAFINSSAVAYLTVPQQLSFRGTGAVASAGAALFPKISAVDDRDTLRRLFLNATWAMTCATVILFVPLTVLFPDFLRLWIGRDFALQSAVIGQLIALSCIARGAFVPYDALFRGTGNPQYLSAVFLATSITGLSLNLLLIPTYGLSGAGYCYLATLFWGFAAIIFAWRKGLHGSSLQPLIRPVVIPILLGLIVLFIAFLARSLIGEPAWVIFGLFYLITMALTAGLLIAAEQVFGGASSHAAALLHALSSSSPRSLHGRLFPKSKQI